MLNALLDKNLSLKFTDRRFGTAQSTGSVRQILMKESERFLRATKALSTSKETLNADGISKSDTSIAYGIATIIAHLSAYKVIKTDEIEQQTNSRNSPNEVAKQLRMINFPVAQGLVLQSGGENSGRANSGRHSWINAGLEPLRRMYDWRADGENHMFGPQTNEPVGSRGSSHISRLHILIALCSSEDLQTALAAGGALAILTEHSKEICQAILTEEKLKASLFRLISLIGNLSTARETNPEFFNHSLIQSLNSLISKLANQDKNKSQAEDLTQLTKLVIQSIEK
ncbi:hypothetical protein H4Q26_001845 [Puccinia striiformis f. sp. tritici PST-130]|nr:hypothetical protein H4Q26_001845 [Puccinia striiformis f. sp. tritici PST-130]